MFSFLDTFELVQEFLFEKGINITVDPSLQLFRKLIILKFICFIPLYLFMVASREIAVLEIVLVCKGIIVFLEGR